MSFIENWPCPFRYKSHAPGLPERPLLALYDSHDTARTGGDSLLVYI
jgi:hypothetical protein